MRVYLAGSGVGDLAEVRAVLEELAAQVLTPLDDLPSATRWSDVMRSAREGADLAVLVIGGKQSTVSTWAVYEAGVLVGAGVPLLILTDPGVELPSPLQNFRAAELPGGIRNTEALRFHLSLFLAQHGADSPAVPERPRPEHSLDADRFRTALQELRHLDDARSRARALEAWTADLFRASGAETYSAIPFLGADRGFDLVVNLPGLRVSGPLVVEVHGGQLSSKRLHADALRLQYAVLQEKAGLGLLLFDEARRSSLAMPVVPMVVVLGAGELIDAVEESGSLVSTLDTAWREAALEL